MKRIITVLAVAALMAAMLTAMAAPAMAAGSDGVTQFDPVLDNLIITQPSDPLRQRVIHIIPTDPLYPTDPIKKISPRNPNVLTCDPTVTDVCQF